MRITRLSSACALAGALVLLAGCGGSSSTSKGSTTPTSKGTTATSSGGTSTPSDSTTASSSTPSASPSPTPTPATAAQLKKIVLRKGDLPSGWKAVPAREDDDDSDDQAKLMKCVGVKNTEADEVATADSDDYTMRDAVISSSASSYKSQSALDNDLAVLKNPRLIPCFSRLLTKELAASLPEDASLGKVSVKFTPGPGTGPANVAGSGLAVVPLTFGEQQVKVYVSFVYVYGPLIEANVTAENVGSPVPAAVLQSAVKAVADRAAATSS
jgi:hypothetical protein